jgi:broad specificity phosphatase PhoE
LSPPLVLHLARHGETRWNRERRLQGQTQWVPLTARGRAQARELADHLAPFRPGAIVSSDLARARETADILAARLTIPVTEEPCLRERSFGAAEGRLVGVLAIHRLSRPDARDGGAESLRDFFDRVAGCLEGLRREPPARRLVVVAHGGVLRVGRAYLAGMGLDAIRRDRIANCALTTVVFPRG